VALVALSIAGCGFTQGAPKADSGTVTVSLSGGAAKPGGGVSVLESATITGITLEITASDMDTITTTIPSGTFETTVDVQAGKNRTFTATVTIATQTFTGSVVQDIDAGSNTTVAIDVTIDGATYPIYTVGGSVSGITGNVTLQLSSSAGSITNTASVSSNGSFAFTTDYFMTGWDYAVTVSSQPSGQVCSVTNGSGTIVASIGHVTNFTVTCVVDTTAPTTTASPAGGTFTGSQSVTLACDDGSGSGCAATYYTTDGSPPTTSSTVYMGAISIGVSTTLRFFSTDNAGNQESANTESYVKAPVTAVIGAGINHSVTLKTDGTIWAWGYNYGGQLGDGTTVDKSSPVQAGSDTNWSSVAAGQYYTIAIKADGTLWAWGANNYGQLGDGTTTNSSSPIQVGADSDWSSVAAGYDHTIAVKTDGTLWAWGGNGLGQLGDGTTTNSSSPLQVGSDTNWSSVAAGLYYTIAIKTDGTLWSWGRNYLGQLGDGTTVDKSNPVQVGTDTNWSSVAGGSAYTIALKADGTLWSWGRNNNYGQLGDGDAWKDTPINIPSFP